MGRLVGSAPHAAQDPETRLRFRHLSKVGLGDWDGGEDAEALRRNGRMGNYMTLSF